MTVKLTIDRSEDLMKQIKSLTQSRVLVGVPAGETERQDGEPITNAALAYIHDNGAPEANIPARPFMRPGIESAEGSIANKMKAGAVKTLQGDKEAVDQTMMAVGLIAQSSIKSKINEGIPPPLAPNTLADRRRRGRTGEIPLIDTGQLRNSINFVVRKK
ncbi:hypothetical protein C3941_19770 [Kaistia algarum]|uniref:hypothetical protein n=1 Tax=Kaistia algarum TaxID=2083279 RepID=UPI000CE76866|nr:hypothetical protein [Kaistia algarum]MCX5516230.1 hypothetical protein [Kaistia algarum]PPE78302.1 hypothetical protein C3941_19770 [Kaistia algarum]